MRSRFTPGILPTCALMMLGSHPALAQISLEAENKEPISIIHGLSSFNVEISKAKLGFDLFTQRPDATTVNCQGLTGILFQDCFYRSVVSSQLPGRNEYGGRFALSAVDGKRDLLSGGSLVPGVEAGASFRRVFSRSARACTFRPTRFRLESGQYVEDPTGGFVQVYAEEGEGEDAELFQEAYVRDPGERYRRQPNGTWTRDESGAWIPVGGSYRLLVGTPGCRRVAEMAWFAAVTGAWTQVKNATLIDPSDSVFLLDNKSNRTLGFAAGFERWFAQDHKLGVSLKWQRSWNSAGETKPLQVCTQKAVGVDTKGALVEAAKCDDRILGELSNQNSLVPRLEWLYRFTRGSGRSLGLLASASTKIRKDKEDVYNLAAGFTLHPDKKPNKVQGALLFIFSDLGNSENQADYEFFEDQFTVRLYLAVDLSNFP